MSAATCTKDGKCSRCGEKGSSALGHSWNKNMTCARCSANYPPNIKIAATNLPYTTMDGVIVQSVSVISKDAFVSLEGNLKVAVELQFSGTNNSRWGAETVYFHVFDSNGNQLSSLNHDVWVSGGTFSETVTIYIPDGDNYTIEICL